jgi:hypothetical protein
MLARGFHGHVMFGEARPKIKGGGGSSGTIFVLLL